MKVAYKDLLNFLSEKPSKQLLSEKLFQLGHEHEIHGDIFDMELTPNRGDCLSLMGLSRDLNIFFGCSESANLYNNDIETLEINFKNFSPNDCPKISFMEIEIEEAISEYQPYLKNYFNNIDNKSTNFFTDISNYTSYELGQPTHCYDVDSMNGDLVFENTNCNSDFKTLLGSEIKLKGNNCVFTIDDEIVSLAGVMGGLSTACSKRTKKVLIECAFFSPESIIGKTIKYNLTSDAAHKFERGVDIECQEKVLRRFAKIVADHAKIKKIKFKSYLLKSRKDNLLPIDVNEVNNILGINLEKSKYLEYLQKLGFHINDNKIKVPSYRNDITSQNDLSEEIARVIGFNSIKSKPIKLQKISLNVEDERILLIESLLIKNGFTQVINFPFNSKKEKDSIKIDNPLDSNKQNFRTSLKDSLIENLLYNERRQKNSIKLFEISDIYTKHQSIKHQKKLGIIISGRLGNNFKEFSIKLDHRYLDQLLNTSSEVEIFKISEIARNTLDSKKKEKILYAEISLDEIPNTFFLNLINYREPINFLTYKPISDFPSSTRDFSFSITNLAIVSKVISLLENISDEVIKESFVFDFYKDEKNALVKLGCRIIFQSHSKTLSDEEIINKVREIINPILELDGVSIPGMSS
jgi:phenylalanyl-tRNA synthetase beta chain